MNCRSAGAILSQQINHSKFNRRSFQTEITVYCCINEIRQNASHIRITTADRLRQLIVSFAHHRIRYPLHGTTMVSRDFRGTKERQQWSHTQWTQFSNRVKWVAKAITNNCSFSYYYFLFARWLWLECVCVCARENEVREIFIVRFGLWTATQSTRKDIDVLTGPRRWI